MWLIITEALLALFLVVAFVVWVFAGARKKQKPKDAPDKKDDDTIA